MSTTKVNPDFILGLKHNANTILVHPTTINNLQPMTRLTRVCLTSEYWHKFMVENADTLTRDIVLKAITDFVYPIDFFPVYFFKKNQTFFLARNCLEAILKLIKHDLTVPNPTDPTKPFRLTIIVNLVPGPQITIDFLQPERLQSILQRRYDRGQRCLDLSRFHTDPDVTEFCVLFQPKLMSYILQFVVDLTPLPTRIILTHNFLKSVEPLKGLAGLPIRLIDLRNNELATIEDLRPLKELQSVAILKLDGNPLCNLYSNYEYVAKLKQICSHIEKIDDEFMFHPNGFYMEKKNFLCTYSCGDLVEQFVQYFFTAYDFEDRTKMADLYHENAIFSLNSYLYANQKTTNIAKLAHYFNISRNMRSPSFSFDNCEQFLFHGVDKIMDVFKELPLTMHDPLQLQCDLMYYRNGQAFLVVNGTFQEGRCKMAFNRSFILQHQGNNVYKIVNEQFHVYNALNYHLRFFQKHPPDVRHSYRPYPFYNRQFWELREAVRNITTMNYDYSLRFLETYNFDLKQVLTNFLKLYTDNEIPPEAFIEPREEPMLDPKSKKKPPLFDKVIENTVEKYGLCTLATAWNTFNEKRLLVNLKVDDPLDRMREMLKKTPETAAAEPLVTETDTDVVTIEDSDDESHETQKKTEPVEKPTVPTNTPGPSGAKVNPKAPLKPKRQRFRKRGQRTQKGQPYGQYNNVKNVVPPVFPSGLINFGASLPATPIPIAQSPAVTVNQAPITVVPMQPVLPMPGKLINLTGKKKKTPPTQHNINIIKKQFNINKYHT